MDEKERAALIRKGNELMNSGQIDGASRIFVATNYRDGLTRVGDHLYFDKRQPLMAYKYYKLAKREDRVNDIFMRMIMAFQALVKAGDNEEVQQESVKVKLPPLHVSPKLKLYAEEILRDNNEKKESEKR